MDKVMNQKKMVMIVSKGGYQQNLVTGSSSFECRYEKKYSLLLVGSVLQGKKS